MKPSAIIVDLDGTLTDCSHRLKYFKGPEKDWAKLEAGIPEDGPIRPIIELVNRYKNGKIIFVTGRAERTRADTLHWIYDHTGLKCFDLLMRPDDDYREDWQVKRDTYNRLIAPFYNVRFVLEDRQQCVDMWREKGLTCLQVAKGDY
jgi:hypothetical protein